MGDPLYISKREPIAALYSKDFAHNNIKINIWKNSVATTKGKLATGEQKQVRGSFNNVPELFNLDIKIPINSCFALGSFHKLHLHLGVGWWSENANFYYSKSAN